MSNTKTVMGQAANTLSIPLDIPDVFSTYLYKGTGTSANSTQTVTNGIDLGGEGGLVWIKDRYTKSHFLFDTERGAWNDLNTDNTNAQGTVQEDGLSSFNSNGFTLTGDNNVNQNYSNPEGNYASWSFLKSAKFFDCVTWTGDGTSNRQIAHNLGSTPGMIIVKNVDRSSNWATLHKDAGVMFLNATSAAYNDGDTGTMFGNGSSRVNPTSTHFTVASSPNTNQNNETHVAYLFAHNDGDGEFGPSGDQDIIKCGSYTGSGSTVSVDLGWEPQWVMIKNTSVSDANYSYWGIYDNMRGMPVGSNSSYVRAESSNAEAIAGKVEPTPTGFNVPVFGTPLSDSNAQTYIYIAIRRGPLYPPTAGTEVFAVATQNEVSAAKYGYYSGFPVDMAWRSITTGEQAYVSTRLTGETELRSDSMAAEANETNAKFDDNESWWGYTTTETNRYSWMLRRAPSFFDCVAWSGSSSSTANISHNLGVAPQMIWAKNRDDTDSWVCYHEATGNTGYIPLNLTSGFLPASAAWNNTTPTATTFSVGNTLNWSTSFNYIAYLFATLAGISKVGSYTGNGTSQTIDCGFTSGARFILVKRTAPSGDWRYFDSKRGIVAGNDTSSKFNQTAGGYRTNVDDVDPHNSGFIINQTSTSDLNVSNATYIFYAIA